MQNTENIIRIVEAVRAIEFYQSMFSENDLWQYSTNGDNSCDRCLYYEGVGTFKGDMLHTLFPDLTIVNEDMIKPNLHPNCVCTLQRISS